jgi:hypothetical protein
VDLDSSMLVKAVVYRRERGLISRELFCNLSLVLFNKIGKTMMEINPKAVHKNKNLPS